MRQSNYFSSIWRHIKIPLTSPQSLSMVRHSIIICANIKLGTCLYILNCIIVNIISVDHPSSLEEWKSSFPFTDNESQAQQHCQTYTESRYHVSRTRIQIISFEFSIFTIVMVNFLCQLD